MKQTTIKLLSVLTLGAALAYIPVASAEVIYQDNFNRTGNLNGSTPTVGGNAWSSANWSTDGSAAKPDANGYMAILPFTPVQGNIYTLSASMNPTSPADSSSWFVLGFTNRNATDNWFTATQSSASIAARVSNNEYPDFYFNGPGSAGFGTVGSYAAGAHLYSITLDTTAGNSANWTVSYSVDGTQVIAPTALGYNPTINYVGFGSGDATGGTISNFSLTFTPVAPAQVIYQDNFNRTGNLNGSTPTVGGNAWSSANWSTDGSAAKPDANGYMAILPFTPVQGNIYTLSASMNPTSPADSSSWFVLGFTNRNATDNWFTATQSSASIAARVSNNEYPDFYFNGPGSAGFGTVGSYAAGAHLYSITLDTTAGNSANWTVSYSVDGTQVIAPTALGYNPTINYVGFGSNDATGGTIDNFSLTVVAVPGSSPYAGWATANAGGQTTDLDYDNDGVANGVEYFMNTTPGFTANPSFVGNTVSWTNGGNISASTYGTQFIVQTSSDLVTWDDVAEGDLNSNTNGPAGSLSYSVDPANGPAKQFVRLKVTPN